MRRLRSRLVRDRPMTAAHLPGAILTPRCRGARAVASSNAAERHGATNQIQRIAGRTANPVGQLSGSANAAHGFCLAVGSAAPFNSNAADARSRATHLRAGWSPSAETHPCNRRCRSIGPEMPARRSSARPAEPFNAASNERSSEPGRCLVSSEAPGCRGDAYTLPSPCEMTTHCMAKANAGVGGRHGCTQHFGAAMPSSPNTPTGSVHGSASSCLPVGTSGAADSHS